MKKLTEKQKNLLIEEAHASSRALRCKAFEKVTAKELYDRWNLSTADEDCLKGIDKEIYDMVNKGFGSTVLYRADALAEGSWDKDPFYQIEAINELFACQEWLRQMEEIK